MKVIITLLALISCACSTKSPLKQPRFPEDQKLRETWTSFRAALNISDTLLLQSLSADSIFCTLCADSAADIVIPANFFYRAHLKEVFNTTLLSYINDSTKVSARYDGSTVGEGDYFMRPSEVLDSARLANIHVGIPIRGEEGLTVWLHFVETTNTYKLFGISTIP